LTGRAGPRRPTRVLFVSHDGGFGGAERSLLGLVSALDRSEFSPIVAAPGRGPLRAALGAAGVPVHEERLARWVPYAGERGPRHLARLLARGPRRVRGLLRAIRAHDADVVCSNTVAVADGAVAAALSRRPHVWHLREPVAGNCDLAPYLPPGVVGRVVARLSDRVVVASRALARGLPANARRRVVVVHNGIDVAAFADAPDARAALARESGLPAGATWVGMVGSVRPAKDPLTLLRAVARLRARGRDVACAVAGPEEDAAYAARCRAWVDAAGLRGRVALLGARTDVASFLAALDVVAVPSRAEGFGRVALEAMAAGKPVVATRCGGPEEVVVDGETGFLVPVGDDGRLAERLEALARDPALAARLGRAGRRRVEERFRADRHVAEVQAVLRAAARRGRAGRQAPRSWTTTLSSP
jgi:glycosyltransferase involved in cell wall biosynthesis